MVGVLLTMAEERNYGLLGAAREELGKEEERRGLFVTSHDTGSIVVMQTRFGYLAAATRSLHKPYRNIRKAATQQPPARAEGCTDGADTVGLFDRRHLRDYRVVDC